MDWEGPEALEKRNAQPTSPKPPVKTKNKPKPKEEPAVAPTVASPEAHRETEAEADESSDDGSGDEYVAEHAKAKSKAKVRLSFDLSRMRGVLTRPPMQRRTRRVSIAESNESDGEQKATRIRRASMMSVESKRSQSPTVSTKRKQSTASAPDPKRQRSMSTAAPGEDATRKYCLTKLEEMFTTIFLRYPVLPNEEHESVEGEEPKKKTQDELTPEEKEFVENTAKNFTVDLEQRIFDIYAEPDKHGKPSAAGKYK